MGKKLTVRILPAVSVRMNRVLLLRLRRFEADFLWEFDRVETQLFGSLGFFLVFF